MPGTATRAGAVGRGLTLVLVAVAVVHVGGSFVAGATSVSTSTEGSDSVAPAETSALQARSDRAGTMSRSTVGNSTSWPQFGHDTANTGYNPDATGPTDSVTYLWNRTADGFVLTSPAVVDGVVFAGRSTGNVTAVDVDTGQLLWRTGTGSTVFSSPAVVDGTVYVGNNDGKLVALDAADGSFEWNFTTGDSVQSAPAVVNGTVYFGSDDSSVYALDAETGAEQWSLSGSHPMRASPAVVNGTVYVGSLSTMYAFDASTGAQQWSYSVAAASSPAVVDGTVYFGSIDASVYALDATTGAVQWNHATSARMKTSPAVANGTVFVGDNDGHLYALDATTGTQQWRFDAPNDVRASPSVADGTVTFGVRSDDVYALDATDGSVRWNLPTPGEVYSPPALVDGDLFIGTRDLQSGRSTLHALSGPPRTTTAVSVESTNSPVEEGGTLDVTATVENTGRKTGTQTVSLTVDGTTRDTTAVTLAGGGSTTVTLEWATASGDAGGYTATVATANDSASTAVTVTSPGEPHSNFSVSVDSTNSPVEEGETLDVTVTAVNIGGASGTQPVSLAVGGTQRDSRSVTLGGGGSKTLTLSWATATGDAGDYTATVSSENDTASTAVDIEADDGAGGSGGGGEVSNRAPIIQSISVSDDSPRPNQLVTVSVDATDPDGTVVATDWSFGDGTSARGTETTHRYDETGLYTITVTATDDDGATAIGSRQVLVQGPPLRIPIDECGVIDESGEYQVVADMNGSDGTCIDVTASHVSLYGGSHTVNGTEADGSVGVSVHDGEATIEDVRISDLDVRNWDRAVAVENATDVAVDGVTAENSGRYAISLRAVEASEVVDSTVTGFGDGSLFQAGIVLIDADDNRLEDDDVSAGGETGSNVALRSGSDDNRIVGNDLHDSGTGLEITESDGTLVRENVAFENDRGVTVDRSDGTTIVDAEVTDNTYGISIHTRSENTLVRSTRITENGPGQAVYGISIDDRSDGTVLENNTISRNDGGGISTTLVRNVTIERNTIASNRGIGVGLTTTWNSTVRANLVSNNTETTYGGIGLDADAGDNLTVANNTFTGHLENEFSGFGGVAVSLVQYDDSVVRGNRIVDGTFGLYTTAGSDNRIVGNVVRNLSKKALTVSSSGDVVVADNVLTRAGLGVRIEETDRTTVRNNTISHNRGPGITTTLVRDVTIAGNTIAANQAPGIGLTTTWNGTVRDNLVRDNADPYYGGDGITADTGANLTVANNTFSGHLEDDVSGFGGTAVSLVGYDDSVVRDNRIVGGTFGLYTTAGSDNRIVGNVVRNHTGTGLTVMSSGDVVVADNLVTGASPGVRIEQAARTTVRNNTLRENEPDLVVAADGGVTQTPGYDGTTVEETTIGTTVVGARFDGDGTIDAVAAPAPYPDRFDLVGSPLRLESPPSQSIDLTIHYGSVDDESDLELWWHVDEWNELEVAKVDRAADTIDVNLAAGAVLAPLVDVSPDLDPSYSPTAPEAGESITFSPGLDPDSTPTVEWDLDGDGQFEREGRFVTRAFDDAGNHSIAVRATTADGVSSVANLSVTVAEARETLTVSGIPVELTYSPGSPQVGETVTLSVSVEDPSVDPVAFEWDFGSDGTVDASGPSATTTYEDPLSVTLTVTLSSGQEVTVSRTGILGGGSPPDGSGGADQTGPVGQPGFGFGVSLAALLGIALLAARRSG